MLPARFDLVEDRRAIIDRRAIAERIAGLPKGAQAEISAILKAALEAGRVEIARRFEAEPARGRMGNQARQRRERGSAENSTDRVVVGQVSIECFLFMRVTQADG